MNRVEADRSRVLAEEARSLRRIDLAVSGLFALAVLAAMKQAAAVLVPVTLAGFVYLSLAPATSALARRGLPRALAAVICLALVAVPLVLLAGMLSEPAASWIESLPDVLADLRAELFDRAPSFLQPVQQVTAELDATVDGVDGVIGDEEEASGPSIGQGVVEWMLVGVPSLFGGFLLTFGLALLLLAGGKRPLHALLVWRRDFGSRRLAVRVLREFERTVSRYLLTVLIVNSALAVVATGLFHLLGVPNPLLWGGIAGLFNFVPFVGAACTTALLFVVGLVEFEGAVAQLLPALCYLALTSLEGQFVTPVVLGWRFDLSPAAVLVSVVLFGWLWGLFGALVAVPLVVSIRVLRRLFVLVERRRYPILGVRDPVLPPDGRAA